MQRAALFSLLVLCPTTAFTAPKVAPAAMPPTGTSPLANQTGEDLLRLATRSLNSSDLPNAAEAYLVFLKDFEDRSETAPIVRKVRPVLAHLLLRLGRFDEARLHFEKALAAQPAYSAPILFELHFQSGLCAMQLARFAEARNSLTASIPPTGASLPTRAQQAHLLIGQCMLGEGNPKDAAIQLAKIRPLLDSALQTRAVALQFRAQLDAGLYPDAFALLLSDTERLSAPSQLLTTQLLLLRLGDGLLERGLNRQAIATLRQIMPFEKLLAHQEAFLKLQARTQDPAPALPQTELETLRAFPNFDLCVRLRQATAYQELQRPHEAALILEDALTRFPKNPLLETAAISLAQCWCDLERWQKIITLATAFQQNFPQSKHQAALAFFKGLAQQKEALYQESLRTLDATAQARPQQEFGLRAEFSAAFTQLLADHPADAAARFRRFLSRHPTHPLAEDASRWLCVALGFDKQHEACRSAADNYNIRFPEGEFRDVVLLQKARASIALKHNAEAVTELRAWLSQFPQHDMQGDAALLLADLLIAQSNYPETFAALHSIPAAQARPFDEGFFKTAKLLKQENRQSELYEHLKRFPLERPESPRLAEAVLLCAKAAESPGATPSHDTELDLAFETLMQLGNNPNAEGVETLLDALLKRNAAPEQRAALSKRIAAAHADAVRSNQHFLSRRLLWSIGRAQLQSDPKAAQNTLLAAAENAPPDSTSPRLLADFAEAKVALNRLAVAKQQWIDLLKWHPRATEKDRAFAFLTHAAATAGDPESAMRWINRFEKECNGSPISGRVLLTKAALQRSNKQPDAARATLEAILKERVIPAESKAEALLQLADSHMEAGQPRRAVAYYQRVYVLYSRWPERVAKAYLRSGEAFEALGDLPAARRTYQEMLASTLPRLAEAQTRLEALDEKK